MKNTLNWFEIPVSEMSRATKFYEAMLDGKLQHQSAGGMEMAMWLPDERVALGGALVLDPKRQPSMNGALVYFNVNDRIDECVARAREAGGEIILPRTDIGEHGFIALIRDTEGNCVGLHSERPAKK